MRRPSTAFIARHPVLSYFLLTFVISWTAALFVAAPYLIRHVPLPKLTAILIFPAMLLGPSLAGVILTRIVDGKTGLRRLLSRLLLTRIAKSWYAALLIPPILVLTVLFCLDMLVSPAYTPNFFLLGVLFGVPAGFVEEIGWTGYVFPKMASQYNALSASIVLGLLWSAWHLPAINYLGAATPHGSYWFPFFLAFTLAMTAMRVLICWIYTNTNSVLIAQLMHISSTGSLVVFSAPRVTAAQEVIWYSLYGAALSLTVGIVVRLYGKRLTRQTASSARERLKSICRPRRSRLLRPHLKSDNVTQVPTQKELLMPDPEPTPPGAVAPLSPAVQMDPTTPADNMLSLLQSAYAAFQLQNVPSSKQVATMARALFDSTKVTASPIEVLVLGLLKNQVCLFEPFTRAVVRQGEGRFSDALKEIDTALRIAEQSIATVDQYARTPDHDEEIVESLQPTSQLMLILLKGYKATIRADVVGFQGKVTEYLDLLREAIGEFNKANDLPPSDDPSVLTVSGIVSSLADRLETRVRFFELTPAPTAAPPTGKKIFVIHGRNEAKWREMRDLLKDQLGQEVVVLEEQLDAGMTVIEKFTKYASECSYAFALLTPDDFVKSGENTIFQARPNVLFEIGWFYGRFGRDRVTLVLQKGTAIPSDLDGIVRVEFQDNVSEKYVNFQNELTRIGLIGQKPARKVRSRTASTGKNAG